MDASTPQVPGDMAKLFSVRFDDSTPRCLQFFYFMKVGSGKVFAIKVFAIVVPETFTHFRGTAA